MTLSHKLSCDLRSRLTTLTIALGIALSAAPGYAEQRVALNFVNSDVAEVVKAIGLMTGKTFVIDPRVKGTLNITSPQPVNKSLAYDILISSLRLQGFAAVEAEGGMVRVVPEADAKLYAVPANSKKTKRANFITRGQIVSKVVPLKHVPASQLVTVLRPLVSPNNVLNADPSSNSLLITDYSENIAHLEEILESIDVPSLNEPNIIPLRYASAQEIAGLINRVFSSTINMPGTTELQRVEVTVDTRSNSLIINTNNATRLARVQALVAKLDVPTPVAGNVHVIYLKNAKAEKIAVTLRNILVGDTSAVQAGVTAAPIGQKTMPGSTPDLGPGMIQADPASNALIVIAPEAIFQNIKAVVEKLDVRRAQVLVEALIAEVSADKAAEFGIQWMNMTSNGVIGGFGSSTATNIAAVAANPALAAQGFSLGLVRGMSYPLGSDSSSVSYVNANGQTVTQTNPASGGILNLGMLARLLESKANANILSTPTLLTLDNEEAKISIGSNVPFLTGQYSVTGNTATASPFSTYERKDVGLTLKIKPQISQGGTINLVVSQEVSKLRQASDPTLSSTDKRSIDTTVLVDDGQTIVIGGLIEEQVQDTEDKVPLLGDIPGLGNLFKYSNRKHVKTNLMVFLRPVIMRDAEKTTAVSNARYEYILNEQRAAAPGHKPLLPDVAPLTLDRTLAQANPRKPDSVSVSTNPVVTATSKPDANTSSTDTTATTSSVTDVSSKPAETPWWTPRAK